MAAINDAKTLPPQAVPMSDLSEILGAIDRVGEMFHDALKSLGTTMTDHYQRTAKRQDDLEDRVRHLEDRVRRLEERPGIADGR